MFLTKSDEILPSVNCKTSQKNNKNSGLAVCLMLIIFLQEVVSYQAL